MGKTVKKPIAGHRFGLSIRQNQRFGWLWEPKFEAVVATKHRETINIDQSVKKVTPLDGVKCAFTVPAWWGIGPAGLGREGNSHAG